jgi:hypothetical protein
MTAPASPSGRLRVVLGLSRARTPRLKLAYQGDERVRVVAACASAGDVLAVLADRGADGAILDEELHGLGREQLGEFRRRRYPAVVLAASPSAPHWEGLAGPVLAPDADPTEILMALRRAVRGEYTPKRRGATAAPQASPSRPTAAPEPRRAPGRAQVVGFWGSGSGRTTLALSYCALVGAGRSVVLVELDTTGASLAAHLDDGADGRPRRVKQTIVELAKVRPATHEAWERELGRALQPLGPYSRFARVLVGVERASPATNSATRRAGARSSS